MTVVTTSHHTLDLTPVWLGLLFFVFCFFPKCMRVVHLFWFRRSMQHVGTYGVTDLVHASP